MKSLKEIYNLPYDTSGFNSGLINWYNQVIDKSYDDLNVRDVCTIIRQSFLKDMKDIAIQKAIDFFLKDPYDGEFNDGDLLRVLVSLDIESIDKSNRDKLITLLKDTHQNYIKFDWFSEKIKIEYADNIDKMIKKLESI